MKFVLYPPLDPDEPVPFPESPLLLNHFPVFVRSKEDAQKKKQELESKGHEVVIR